MARKAKKYLDVKLSSRNASARVGTPQFSVGIVQLAHLLLLFLNGVQRWRKQNLR